MENAYISLLKLSKASRNALTRAGILTIESLEAAIANNSLKRIRGIGKVHMNEIINVYDNYKESMGKYTGKRLLTKIYFNRFRNNASLNKKITKIQREENGTIKSIRVVDETCFCEGNYNSEGSFTVEIIYTVEEEG